MSQLDVTVREAAATSLGVLASHLPEQAAAVAAGDSLPLLVTAMRVRFWPLGGDVHRLPCCLLTLPNIPSHDCAGAGASVEARSVRGAG